MPRQSRVSLFQHHGPFLGLDTTQGSRELDPRYCVDAKNILLSEGRIRPRGPFAEEFEDLLPRTALVGPLDIEVPRPILSMFHWRRPDGAVVTFLIYSEGLFSIVAEEGTKPVCQDLDTGFLTDGPASFVPANGLVYIISNRDASGDLWKSDGTLSGTKRVGLAAPVGKDVAGTPEEAKLLLTTSISNLSAPTIYAMVNVAQSTALSPATYSWAITRYDSRFDVESNPHYTAEVTILPGENRSIRVKWDDAALEDRRRFDEVRLYRKNVTLSEPGWRLVDKADFNAVDPRLLDDANSRLSTAADGPFAPSKNGVPENATMGVFFKNRMFYTDSENPELLRYSEFGHPDHVDPADWINLTGDQSSGITGLAELSGQLIILKRTSIWVLAGVPFGHTNRTIALGGLPVPSSHELYRTASTVGCANVNGPNGAIVTGSPPLLFFPNEAGFYRFNGIESVMVSPQIKPTWRKWARRPRHTHPVDPKHRELEQQVTYAVDPLNEIIYLAQPHQEVGEPQVLAFHYGIGAWTYLTADEMNSPIISVATSLGRVERKLDSTGTHTSSTDPEFYSPLWITTQDGKLYGVSREVGEQFMPQVRYESGRMQLIEGRRKHCYTVTWLHDQPAIIFDGNISRLTSPPRLQVGVRVDGESLKKVRMIALKMRTGTYTRQPVRREFTDLAFIVESGENILWDPEIAVTGWSVDMELAGRGG